MKENTKTILIILFLISIPIIPIIIDETILKPIREADQQILKDQCQIFCYRTYKTNSTLDKFDNKCICNTTRHIIHKNNNNYEFYTTTEWKNKLDQQTYYKPKK